MADPDKPEEKKNLGRTLASDRLQQYEQHIAKFRKLTLPSTDVGTYYFQNPTVVPDTASTSISFQEMEKLYWTNPLVNKALNIRANRVIGDGFKLNPSDSPSVNPEMAQQAAYECEEFLKRINYITFFRNSIINAYVAGNEWTELIYSRALENKRLLNVNHGDFRTLDFRRGLIDNKILLDQDGEPVGYWQYISDLSQLYRNLSVLFGSEETLENLQAAKDRLLETQHLILEDQNRRQVGVIFGGYKPNYMFINKDEIIHLSFNNLNDNFYGTTMIIAAYDAIYQLNQIQLALGETINNMGYPKPVLKFGDEKNPPSTQMAEEAQKMVKDPVRQEAFAMPYYFDMTYLTIPPGAAGSNASDYPDWYVTAISIGLRVPKELLTGEGDANRASSVQQSTDFEKDIEADRRVFEEYVYRIFSYFLETRGFIPNSPMMRNPYVPEIVWPKLVTEDQKLREDMVLAKYNAGLLTVNEARQMLELPEIEDVDKGESFANENKAQPQFNPADQSVASLAHFALEKKSELNPKLNKTFGTKNINYHKIATTDIGKKIRTVSQAKAKQIRDALVNGEANKESAKGIFEKVKKIGAYTDDEARRVLATEQVNLMENAKLASAKKAGMKTKKWDATLDKHTSPLCEALHGQEVPIDQDFKVTYQENGKTKKWRGKSPAAHPWCRSMLVYGGGD